MTPPPSPPSHPMESVAIGNKIPFIKSLVPRIKWVCKHCQFVYASSVLSVMSVSGFPLIIMSAHAQCSMCTCSVEGILSLVCLHMLSVGASLISMQCKHWRRRRIFGEDDEKIKNPSSLPKILHLRHKKGRLRHKIRRLDWLNTNTNRQRWPSRIK